MVVQQCTITKMEGKLIQDLLWLLRLRSQTTLETYLQEVAALNLFARLPPDARACIKYAADAFAFLLHGDCSFAGYMTNVLCDTRLAHLLDRPC